MCWGCKRWWGRRETQKRTNDFCPDLSAVVQASCALRATASAKQSRAKAKPRRDDEGGRDIRTQPGGSTPGIDQKSGALTRRFAFGVRGRARIWAERGILGRGRERSPFRAGTGYYSRKSDSSMRRSQVMSSGTPGSRGALRTNSPSVCSVNADCPELRLNRLSGWSVSRFTRVSSRGN